MFRPSHRVRSSLSCHLWLCTEKQRGASSVLHFLLFHFLLPSFFAKSLRFLNEFRMRLVWTKEPTNHSIPAWNWNTRRFAHFPKTYITVQRLPKKSISLLLVKWINILPPSSLLFQNRVNETWLELVVFSKARKLKRRESVRHKLESLNKTRKVPGRV